MGTTQIVAFVILCAIPAGIWLRCWYRDRSREIHNDMAILLANGLDEFDEDGTDPQLEARCGKHRK